MSILIFFDLLSNHIELTQNKFCVKKHNPNPIFFMLYRDKLACPMKNCQITYCKLKICSSERGAIPPTEQAHNISHNLSQ